MVRRWKNRSTLIMFYMALLISFIPLKHVRAKEPMGSITIQYHGRIETGEVIPLKGVSFLLYQVGEREEDEWKLTREFRDSEISIKDQTASARKKQAEQLYSYARKHQIAGWQQMTDVRGCMTFGKLKEGLYLLAQEQPISHEEKGTFFSAPFLISIPEEETGIYDRVVLSKSEWEPPMEPETPPSEKPAEGEKPFEKPEENRPVKTGDEAPLSELLVIICMAGVMIATLIKKR